jgi:hypothetical protein
MIGANSSEASVNLALILALLPLANATVYAGDTPVEGAVHLDISPEGFGALGALVPAIAPSEMPVDGISDGYEGWLTCFGGGYEYEVSDLNIGLEFDDVSISPNTGYLDIDIRMYVNVNNASDPFYLYLEALCIGDDCDAWVDPFEVNVATTMALEIVEDPEGNTSMDATIGELSFDYALTGDDVTIEGCALGTILDVLDFIGIDLIDLILPAVSGALDDAVADLAPELETTLEDAFAAAKIEQEIDLQGNTILLSIQPGDIQIKPEGMRLTMDGMTDALETNTCIAEWDEGTFEAHESSPPPIGHVTEGIDSNYAASVLLADEFGNQLLYTVWKTGLLCYTVDDELGFPIDTALLGLLAGEAFKELFPESKPMVIETQPRRAPTLAFTVDNDVNVIIEELGLNFMAELDHRKARVLAMDLEVDAGVDLNFDGTTGGLGVIIDLGADAIESRVASNDFVPEATPAIEESFGTVFTGLVGGLVGDMIGDLNFNIPGFSGIGLTALSIAPAGLDGDWLGGYAWLGEVSYASAGCAEDGSGGCSDAEGGGCTDAEGGGCTDAEGSGCSGGGCAAAPRSQRRWLWLTFPFALAILRRRD